MAADTVEAAAPSGPQNSRSDGQHKDAGHDIQHRHDTQQRAASQIALRDYQVDVIQRLRQAVGDGYKRPLLAAPTGAGKTIMVAAVIANAVAKQRRVLVLAHRRELIQQTAEKLWQAAGLDAGVIMAGYPSRPDQPVQLASLATLYQRAHRTSGIEHPPANLLVVDEAHRARAQTYNQILEVYPNATVIGLTATPCRGDGKGLGNIFDTLVECPDVAELIRLGFLVPTTVYAPSTPDLSGVETRRGDYVESQLADRMDDAQLVGDVIQHWHRLASDRQTVVFASSVAHSVHLRDEFRRSGINAEHVDGSTPSDERDAILARLAAGQVQVVTNCNFLTEGWDSPAVSACVLARPTRHMGLYRQMIGRVLRPAPGKTDALILDHAGCTHEHGFAEESVAWSLDTDARADSPEHTARKNGEAPTLKDCPECGALRKAGQSCGACGWQPKKRPEAPEVADGDLERVERDGTRKPVQRDRRAWHAQLLFIANERGYKPGWAAMKFKEKFGTWPPSPKNRPPAPQTPSPEVRAWEKSRRIAYAKAMDKRRAGADA